MLIASQEVPDPFCATVHHAIYQLVGRGWSDMEIAGHLKLSERVVRCHVLQMMLSSKLHDRLELIHQAFSALSDAGPVFASDTAQRVSDFSSRESPAKEFFQV